MARVHIDPIKVKQFGNKVGTKEIRAVITETVALSKRWPRAGNPAWTDSYGHLNRATTGQTYSSPAPHGYVRNNLVYALAVHQGTPERIILARSKRGMTFWWKRRGKMVYKIPWIVHPATKGSFFLSEPLRIVAKKHHMKVTGKILP